MNPILESILDFIRQNATDIISIIILFFFGRLILKLIVKRLARMVDDGDAEHVSQKEKRAETLGHIIVATGNTVIYLVITLMVLSFSTEAPNLCVRVSQEISPVKVPSTSKITALVSIMLKSYSTSDGQAKKIALSVSREAIFYYVIYYVIFNIPA